MAGVILGFGARVFAGGHPESRRVLELASDRPWTDERSERSDLLFHRSVLALG
jgi:hypothetical protein